MSNFKKKRKNRRLAREAEQKKVAEAQTKIAELRKPLERRIVEAGTWTEKQNKRRSRPPTPAPALSETLTERADLRRLTDAGARARLQAERNLSHGNSDAQDGWYETEFEGLGQYDIGGT